MENLHVLSIPSAETIFSLHLPALLIPEKLEGLLGEMKQLELTPKCLLTIDASQVDYITAAGAQLLVALSNSVTALQGQWQITGYKDFFKPSLEALGLSWLLGPSLQQRGEHV